MLWAALILYHLWVLHDLVWAQDEVTAITPQNCSLDCIQKGEAGCEYCRITRSDITNALGFNSFTKFGSCIPWPCFHFFGREDPHVCQHFVHAPNYVKIEFLDDPNPLFDTMVVSWRPSYYGIAFLRGFQVTLQHLGGSSVSCQLFLFHRNLTLQASHAQMVYQSDPFPGLSLGTQYAVTVMALPVPEQWEKFYHSEIISTRSCPEKNGLDRCNKDWYPKYTEVTQEGTNMTVTFNLAPPHLGIGSYFLQCYANGIKTYIGITPNLSKNETHHSIQLSDLMEGVNYTCEIAADKEDAVRKTFSFYVQKKAVQAHYVKPSLALMLPLSLVMLVVILVLLASCIRKSTWRTKNLFVKPGLFPPSLSEMEQHQQESNAQEEAAPLPTNGATPPRLLICYSSNDGPAHVKAVMQLGAFIQQHMATQVCLDLWDSLSVAREGSMTWYCQQIRESDFILVVCSQGLNLTPEDPVTEDAEGKEADLLVNCASGAAVKLIGEEVGRAKARGQDLSKYIAAIFEYCQETDIPTELRLVSNYTLPNDLELLFSHLHGMNLYRPGSYLKVNHISVEGFIQLPAGAALQQAIHDAGKASTAKRHQSLDREE